MKSFRPAAGLLALVLLTAFPLRAQQDGPVETRLEARKVTRAADGRETLGPAESVRPGDVIEYTATYRNKGAAAVKNLEATLPIPANTELLAATARPANALASTDASRFSPMPLKRSVVRDGRSVEETVPLSQYRYLRWSAGELAPGKALNFTARVRVLDRESQ